MKTYIYIDGFNFYYSAVKGTPYKWLDLKTLFTRLLSDKNKIESIKYFTALVDGKEDPNKPKRQNAYLRALREYIPEISIYYGHFLTHPTWRRLVKPKKNKYAYVYKREEKGSDVNLAVHLLNDAWLDKYECAIIVSNDSDIEEAVKIARNDLNKIIGWIIYDTADPKNYRPSKELRKYAHFIKHITKSSLAACQLPDKIPGTNITKPNEW